MTFNDSDLKRLKDCIDKGDDLDWMYTIHDGFTDDKHKALLARLEAAEVCGKLLNNLVEMQKLQGSAKEAVEAWRKTAGK